MGNNGHVDIETLYFDTDFRDYLDMLCSRNLITYADDFHQDVFMRILENGVTNRKQCKRIAHTLAMREYRSTIAHPFPFEIREGHDAVAGRVIA